MKVAIHNDDAKGFVHYNESTKEIVVEFPDGSVKKKVENYLHKRRAYKIPESQRIDDYRVDNEYPYTSKMYFELAMCTLYHNTNVWVDWR
jgi:hypothetical protein